MSDSLWRTVNHFLAHLCQTRKMCPSLLCCEIFLFWISQELIQYGALLGGLKSSRKHRGKLNLRNHKTQLILQFVKLICKHLNVVLCLCQPWPLSHGGGHNNLLIYISRIVRIHFVEFMYSVHAHRFFRVCRVLK